MSKNTLTTIVILIVVAGGAAWYVSSRSGGTDGAIETGALVPPADNAQNQTPQTVTVTYDGTSFSPSSVRIKVGDTVTFANRGSGSLWVAADLHPTHTEYDGTSRTDHCAASYAGPKPFDACGSGTDDYSFTFTKTGTWEYHNHVNPPITGEVIVE